MTSQPSDRAIAQAFREALAGHDGLASTYQPDAQWVLNRARELDAAKGGEDERIRAMFDNALCARCGHVGKFTDPHECTPPAQAAEAVERVARAIGDVDGHTTSPGHYERMARAAIAAMQAGD